MLALKKEFIDDAVKVLVTRFIPLTQSDLEKWMADPEEWVNREEHENEFWEYELRVRITLSEDSHALAHLLDSHVLDAFC
jgi:uncharacterized HAD superfamily protein